MTAPGIGETTTVSRTRSDMRLKECAGYALALHLITDECEDVPAHAVAAIVNALMFSLERLCEEHGLTAEGRRL